MMAGAVHEMGEREERVITPTAGLAPSSEQTPDNNIMGQGDEIQGASAGSRESLMKQAAGEMRQSAPMRTEAVC
jgi:hypothetical protein